MKNCALLLAFWLVGCAATADAGQTVGCGWSPDPEIYGAHLDTDDCNVEVCRDPDLKKKVRRAIEVSADYWDTHPDILYGWKIRLVDSNRVHCTGFGPFESFGPRVISGCVDWAKLTINLSVVYYDGGVEGSMLLHEMGHVVLAGGDPGHWRPRWWDIERQRRAYWELFGECRVNVSPALVPLARENYPDLEIRDDGCIVTKYDRRWDG